uniref:Uncharacterized protein n=1 Tax=Anguilla anguilla TaxID=7936 RepID=A0A0E9U406_ANGAN
MISYCSSLFPSSRQEYICHLLQRCVLVIAHSNAAGLRPCSPGLSTNGK